MKTDRDYVELISDALLKKYYKRQSRESAPASNRRIQLKLSELERHYEDADFSLLQKEQIHDAVNCLEQRGYVTVKRLKFSDDVQKLYLKDETVPELENYILRKFGVETRGCLMDEIQSLISEYAHSGALTAYYAEKLSAELRQSAADIRIERERNLFRALDFLQNNRDLLYIREASMLIFGESKKFEREYRACISGILKEYHTGTAGDVSLTDDEGNDASDLLSLYGITEVDQDICIQGDFTITFPDSVLHTKGFSGGISIAHADVMRIRTITVNTAEFMTIENKTAFQRYSAAGVSTMYLGGFANSHQLAFLKKVHMDNPNTAYAHFGDIDVGGFLIHEHLCRESGIPFTMFKMGIEDLKDKRYANCLQPLTENDRTRAKRLLAIPEYRDVIHYMLENSVKLEQEIISYYGSEKHDYLQ